MEQEITDISEQPAANSSDSERQEKQDDSKIIYRSGNLLYTDFDRAVIIHSTNCLGRWGAGFALSLKRLCPAAFEVYREYCQAARSPQSLVGSCLVIEPQPSDYETREGIRNKPRWFIACLFVSVGYGRRKGNNPGQSTVWEVLAHTDLALFDMHISLNRLDFENAEDEVATIKPGDLYSPKISTGLFGVPWDNTTQVIEAHLSGSGRKWVVYS